MTEFAKAKSEIDSGILSKAMLTIVGTCSVDYIGRATSTLPMGRRLILIKGDNSISIHQNRLVRPTNYMMGARISCGLGEGTFILKATKIKPVEKLAVAFREIEDIRSYEMEPTDDLRLSGSERDLNNALMQDLSMIEPGLVPINQQQHFRRGICDIIAQDKNGNLVVIELKRRLADFESVTQLHRYMHEVQKLKGIKTRGILLAPGIRKNARELLGQLGLEFAKLDFELTPHEKGPKAKIKGFESRQQMITQHMGRKE